MTTKSIEKRALPLYHGVSWQINIPEVLFTAGPRKPSPGSSPSGMPKMRSALRW